MGRPDIPHPDFDPIPDRVWVLRIPKTGSGTLVAVMGKMSRGLLSHSENLDDVLARSGGGYCGIVAAVRDPVARFRSGFDMYRLQGHTPKGMTVQDFADLGPGEWLKPDWGSAFWRQTYWLRSVEHVRRWGVTVLNTPQLDEQLQALRAKGWPLMGASHVRHNAGGRRSLFTDPTGIVREWYADDMDLVAGLGY
jgi:hypothetical protein